VKADLESTPEPLDAWHRSHGARWHESDGRRRVAAYGDVVSELAILRQACGLIEQRWVEGLIVSGEDRRRFLNGYLTCDVASLESGAGVFGFFTNAQGRVLADAVVTAADESLLVEVPHGRREPLIEHLSRYILADRVALEPEPAAVRWLLVGAGAEETAQRLAPAVPQAPWSTVDAELDSGSLAIRREQALVGVAVLSLRVEAGAAEALGEELLAVGAEPVGFDALETLRIEAGVPRYGADFGEAHFPQEVGFEEAVSYTKGCYLGQEVVARIHYRGHVNHQLCALRIDSGTVPDPGPVEFEGQEVGRLGSAVYSPSLDGTIGLAILHRKAVASGTIVSLPGGVGARVEEPGFASAKTSTSAG